MQNKMCAINFFWHKIKMETLLLGSPIHTMIPNKLHFSIWIFFFFTLKVSVIFFQSYSALCTILYRQCLTYGPFLISWVPKSVWKAGDMGITPMSIHLPCQGTFRSKTILSRKITGQLQRRFLFLFLFHDHQIVMHQAGSRPVFQYSYHVLLAIDLEAGKYARLTQHPRTWPSKSPLIVTSGHEDKAAFMIKPKMVKLLFISE